MDVTAFYLRLHATSPKGVPYKDMFIFISIRHPLYCLVSLEIAVSVTLPFVKSLSLTLHQRGEGVMLENPHDPRVNCIVVDWPSPCLKGTVRPTKQSSSTW